MIEYISVVHQYNPRGGFTLMKYSDQNKKIIRFNEQIRLETCFAEEQKYIWKNMVRIEKIKKENLNQKDRLLRKSTYAG